MSKVQCLGLRLSTLYRPSRMFKRLAGGIMSDKDMCTCGEAVGNVNSAMMRTDRWSMKLLPSRLEALCT